MKNNGLSDDKFNSLARNAFQFMEQGVSCIKSDGKLSVIYFWAATELIVKARLLKEHWSLIIDDPSSADRSKFESGDFKSVSFDEAVSRLNKIVGTNLAGHKSDCFKILKAHRNRLLHFFNDAYAGQPSVDTVEEIAIEQCRAWHYINIWLRKVWVDDFASYTDEIDRINESIKKNREYLKVRYDNLKDGLAKGKSRGDVFSDCASCGYPSFKESVTSKEENISLINGKCLVCNLNNEWLRVTCPHCGDKNQDIQNSDGECEACQQQIDIDDLVDTYGEKKLSEKDEYLEPSNAYCGHCEYYDNRSVIPFSFNQLCLNCLTVYEDYEVENCGWCSENIAGLRDASFIFGCGVVCEGKGIPND